MDHNFLILVLVGLAAQLIDGSLGMAYGVSSNTFLLSMGIPPAVASASVHASEMFTTAASGLSHWHFSNVDKKLVKSLVIPGVLGGVLGAYVLTSLPTKNLKLFVSIYLLIMGINIFLKVVRAPQVQKGLPTATHISLLGLIGGFCDAAGGGGWGPIVTTTLIARGNHPRTTIGSVNICEFAVTVAESATFALTLGFVHWQVVLGLLLGGVMAAPLGAYLTNKLPVRSLMGVVGALIIILSIRTIVLAII